MVQIIMEQLVGLFNEMSFKGATGATDATWLSRVESALLFLHSGEPDCAPVPVKETVYFGDIAYPRYTWREKVE